MNALDRILLTLKRAHSEIFDDVCAGDISPRKGAIKAGLVAEPDRPRGFGVCDFSAAVKLSTRVQGDLLWELFKALSLDAQCSLISRVLETRLGPELARRWREGGKRDRWLDTSPHALVLNCPQQGSTSAEQR